MIRSGPRSGFRVLTFASVHGLRLAVAAWNNGTPDAGTANSPYSCLASQLTTDRLHRGARPGAEGALEVAVLDQRDWRGGWPEDVVSFGINRRIKLMRADLFHGKLLSR